MDVSSKCPTLDLLPGLTTTHPNDVLSSRDLLSLKRTLQQLSPHVLDAALPVHTRLWFWTMSSTNVISPAERTTVRRLVLWHTRARKCSNTVAAVEGSPHQA
jgi:hypothetical protein